MAGRTMERGHVGRSVERIEDASLLSGRARFADHYPERPETLHAAVLRSPHAHAEIISLMYDRLAEWARRCSQRTTVTDDRLLANREGGPLIRGVLIGVNEAEDIPAELSAAYRGPVRPLPDRN